ncbi:MAG: metallophosphoesterase family protein [Solirubrobacteraceae bacterium]
MRLFYASDVHGSDRCFRKFLNAGSFYGADALVLGGDITGKAIVPLVERAPGELHATFLGTEHVLAGEEEAAALERRIADTGYYSHRCSPDEEEALRTDPEALHALFVRRIVERMERWMELADERLELPCFVNAGNDDPPEVDAPIEAADRVTFLEGRVVRLPADVELASCGYANRTPWNCPRDVEESELAERLQAVASQVEDPGWALFNFHCPPYDSQIDQGPRLDEDFRLRQTAGGVETHAVGSTACREVIERYQPLMGLHGHLHESRGTVKLGRTLCVNPGSEYTEGVLHGAVIDLHERKRKVKNCVLTTG